MIKMNKLNDPQKTAKIMSEFEKQNMKMNMTDEMSINQFLFVYLIPKLLDLIIFGFVFF